MKTELVAYQKDYLKEFIAYRNQPSTLRHNPIQKASNEEVEKRLKSGISDLSKLEVGKEYFLFISTDHGIVGNVVLTGFNANMNYAEIGYGVYEKYQNRGFGTSGVSLFIERIFKLTSLRKIIAYVHDKNVPSCKLLERIGFKKEGLLREHYIINGKPENEIVYGLLRSDFSLVQ